jgi:hypothetical protein
LESTLNNCTVTGNMADYSGGVYEGALNNCIVYFNTASTWPNYNQNDWAAVLSYCCTTPMPTNGVGNITNAPLFVDYAGGNLRLQSNSPCINAGENAFVQGQTDLDGLPRLVGGFVDIGAYEYQFTAPVPLWPLVRATYTRVPAGFVVGFTGQFAGHPTVSRWDFGDGTSISNQLPSVSHNWAEPGDYLVALWGFNDSHPEGVSAGVIVHVGVQPIHYVAAGSTNPLPPYSSWATAATNIQDAVDAADGASSPPGWVLVLVTNGVYATGGRAVVGTTTNRLTVDTPLIVRSVNGPDFTIIRGYQVPGMINGNAAIRCVCLADGASLSGFTLTNGATLTSASLDLSGGGGGVWCSSQSATVSNCVLVGNSAGGGGGGAYSGTLNNCTLSHNSSAGDGGGAYSGWLNNCTLAGNSSIYSGGGARECTLNNCTLTANSALTFFGGGAEYSTLNNCTLTSNSAKDRGGGACGGTLNNCIVYYNTAPQGVNYYQDQEGGILNHCCTTPMPTSGVGNIINPPLFLDYANRNLRLQSNSPCINAGNNTYVTTATDVDGNPRIVSGTVDIGAYEFQGTGSMISYAWLEQYGLPTDGSADFMDPDRDGMNNWQEWRCGTCPTNANSALRLLSPQRTETNVTVAWQSVAGVSYFLERSTNLGASVPFSPLVIGIPGQAGMTSYADTSATNTGPYFYRVGVGN